VRRGVAVATAAIVAFSVATSVLTSLIVHLAFAVPAFPMLLIAGLTPLIIATPVSWALVSLIRRLDAAERRLDRLARTDDLTGLFNRRHFFAVGEGLFYAARRYGEPLSVALLDADHFKSINDRRGHAAGDVVLCALAGVIGVSLRDSDVAARIGGEEFAVLMPQTDAAAARVVAERLRRGFEADPAATAAAGRAVTVSIGIAERYDGDRSLEAVMARADAALYRAKAEGRNQVRGAGAA